MSALFDITHRTHYRYARPVLLGEHRVLFRPRGSHDIRVLATDMSVPPMPPDIRLIQDVHSNSVALMQPRSPRIGSINHLLVNRAEYRATAQRNEKPDLNSPGMWHQANG